MVLLSQLMDQKDPEANDINMRTGCTPFVLGIDEKNKKLYFANAGDSRVVMSKNGVSFPQSEEHKRKRRLKKLEFIKLKVGKAMERLKGI